MIATRVGNLEKLDRTYVRAWLTRLFGRRVYEQIWDPLLRSKLGAARDRTSAAFIWTTIRRLYGARSGTEKVERMGHVHGGYRRILSSFRNCLEKQRVRIRTSEEVLQVAQDGDNGFLVKTIGGSYRFNRVICTVPNPIILHLINPGRKDQYWEYLAKVEYLGVVCVLLILTRSLSPFYVTNLLDTSLTFTGIIEASNVISPQDLNGRHVVYLPRYLALEDPVSEWSDEQITARFLDSLRIVFPGLSQEEILHMEVFRERYVQPLQDIDYIRRQVGFRTPVSGMYVANTSMIANSTLNNNAVIRLARKAAVTVLEDVNGCT